MKTVNYLSIFLLITCCCSSCEEIVYESLSISIQNRIEDDIHITLYPKNLITESSYGNGSGGKQTKFVLYPYERRWNSEWDEVLFLTKDINIEPHILASQVFDSIYICRVNEDDVIMKFTHEKATGYSENLFSETSTWECEIEKWVYEPDEYTIHVYKFFILKDKIIIE